MPQFTMGSFKGLFSFIADENPNIFNPKLGCLPDLQVLSALSVWGFMPFNNFLEKIFYTNILMAWLDMTSYHETRTCKSGRSLAEDKFKLGLRYLGLFRNKKRYLIAKDEYGEL